LFLKIPLSKAHPLDNHRTIELNYLNKLLRSSPNGWRYAPSGYREASLTAKRPRHLRRHDLPHGTGARAVSKSSAGERSEWEGVLPEWGWWVGRGNAGLPEPTSSRENCLTVQRARARTPYGLQSHHGPDALCRGSGAYLSRCSFGTLCWAALLVHRNHSIIAQSNNLGNTMAILPKS
jgi:hypothetical protein